MDEAKYKVSAACIAKTFYDTPAAGNPFRNDKRAIVTIAHAILRYGGNFNGGVLIWNTTLPQTYTDQVELEAYTAMHMVMVHDLPPRTTPYMVITAEPATGDALYADLYSRIGSIEHITVAPHAVSGNTLELKQAAQRYTAVQATVAGVEAERDTANTSVRDLTTVQGAIQSAIALGDIAIYDKAKIFDHNLASAKRTCITALTNVMSDYSGKKTKRIDNSVDIYRNDITLRHHGFRTGTEVTLSNAGAATGLTDGKVYTVGVISGPHMFQLLDPVDSSPQGNDGMKATDMVVNYTRRTAVEEFVHTMNNATPAQVNSVVFSTDGEYALTSYDDSPICVRWSTPAAGAHKAIGLYLHSTSSNVISVAAADTSGIPTFAVAGEDGTVDIIDSESGTNRQSIKAFVAASDYSIATSMCCSNDGAWIAVGDNDGYVTVISPDAAATGAATAPAAIAAADAAAAVADAARLPAAASPAAAAAAAAAAALAIAAAAAANAAAGIILQEAHPGASGDSITSVAFRQKDGMLVACQDHHIAMWLAWQDRRDQVVKISDTATQRVNSVCFSGDYLVYGREDGVIISLKVADVVSGLEKKVATFEKCEENLTEAQRQLQDDVRTASNYDTVIAAAAAAAGLTPIEFAEQAITTGLNLVMTAVLALGTSPLAANGNALDVTEVAAATAVAARASAAESAAVAAGAVPTAISVSTLVADVRDELPANWSVYHIMRLVYTDVVEKLAQGPVALAGVWMQAAVEAKATAQLLVDRYESQYDARIANTTAVAELAGYRGTLDFSVRPTLVNAGQAIRSVSSRQDKDFFIYGGDAGVGSFGSVPGATRVIDYSPCNATAVHPDKPGIVLFGTDDQALGYASPAVDASPAVVRRYGRPKMFDEIVKPVMKSLRSRVTPAALPPYTIPGPVRTFTALAEEVVRHIDNANAAADPAGKFNAVNDLFASSLGWFVAIFDNVLPREYLATKLFLYASDLAALQNLYQAIPAPPDHWAHLGTFKLFSVSNAGMPTYTNTLTHEKLAYSNGEGWIINDRDDRAVWKWNPAAPVHKRSLAAVTAAGTNGGTSWEIPRTEGNTAVSTIVFSAAKMYTADVRSYLDRKPMVATDAAYLLELREAAEAAGHETRTQDTQIETLKSNVLNRVRAFLKVSKDKKTLERQLRLSRADVVSAQDQRAQADGRKNAMEREKNEAIEKAGVAKQRQATADLAAQGANDARVIADDEKAAAITLLDQQGIITREMLGSMQMIDGDGAEASGVLMFYGEVLNGKPVFVDGGGNALVFYSDPGNTAFWVLLELAGGSAEAALADGTGFICRARASGDAEWFPMACTGWEGWEPSPPVLVAVAGAAGAAATLRGRSRGFKLKHVGGGPAKYVHAKTMALNTELTTEARELQAKIKELAIQLTREGAAYEVEIAQKSRAADVMQGRIEAFDKEATQHADRLTIMKRGHDAAVALLQIDKEGRIKTIARLEQMNIQLESDNVIANASAAAADAAVVAAGSGGKADIDKALSGVSGRVDDLTDLLTEAKSARDKAEGERDKAEGERDKAEGERDKAEGERDTARLARDKASGELAVAAASTGTTAAARRAELESVNAAHANTQQKLRDQVAQLNAEVARARRSGGVFVSPTPSRGSAAIVGAASGGAASGGDASASSATSSAFGSAHSVNDSALRMATQAAADAAAAAASGTGTAEIVPGTADRVRIDELVQRKSERAGNLALVSPGIGSGTGAANLGSFELSNMLYNDCPRYEKYREPPEVGVAGALIAAVTSLPELQPTMHLFKYGAFWYVAPLPVWSTEVDSGDEEDGDALKEANELQEAAREAAIAARLDTPESGWWRVQSRAQIPIGITERWTVFEGGGMMSSTGDWAPVPLDNVVGGAASASPGGGGGAASASPGGGGGGGGIAWRTRIVVEAAVQTVRHYGYNINANEAHDILVELKTQETAVGYNAFRPARFYKTMNELYNLPNGIHLRYLCERLGLKAIGKGWPQPTGEELGAPIKMKQDDIHSIRLAIRKYVGYLNRATDDNPLAKAVNELHTPVWKSRLVDRAEHFDIFLIRLASNAQGSYPIKGTDNYEELRSKQALLDGRRADDDEEERDAQYNEEEGRISPLVFPPGTPLPVGPLV